MRRFVILLFAACLAATGCSQSPTGDDLQSHQETQAELPKALANATAVGDFLIGEPIRYKNLTVFPVSSKVPRSDDRYITLEEGLKAGTVQVFEVGAGRGANNRPRLPQELDLPGLPNMAPEPATEPPAAPSNRPAPPPADNDPFSAVPPSEPDEVPEQVQMGEEPDDQVSEDGDAAANDAAVVNTLMVLNRSEKPLYLMPGEIIYGGQQDRAIAEEAIIMASDKPVPVKVFCVEAGRWHGKGEDEAVAELAPLVNSPGEQVDEHKLRQLAKEARKGKFVVQAGNLNSAGRMAIVEEKDQGEVWGSVGSTNAASSVVSQTSAFTANYISAEVSKQIQEYIEQLQSPVADQPQVVGVIVAINGKVEAVDVFQSTPLFRKLWPTILKSHALDAANAARQPDAEKLCTVGNAADFFQTAMQADVKKNAEGQGGLVVTKRDSQDVVSSAAFDKAAPALMLDVRGGFGGAVHASGFAK
jgi:hypothetical protein